MVAEAPTFKRLAERIVVAGYSITLKRLFDLCGALILFLLALPFFLLIPLGIWMSSPGPVFYLGQRTGLSGRPFFIFKFRTMTVDAELKGGSTTALGDMRIFPFGRFLRRYKLDELPQIINVLRGEMSLVGPRPELLRYTSQYTKPEQRILAVRPGITDLSSIHFSSLDEVVGSSNADKVFEKKFFQKRTVLD